VNFDDADLTGVQGLNPDVFEHGYAYLTGATWPLDTPVPQGWAREPDTGWLYRASTPVSDRPVGIPGMGHAGCRT
jgi:hypothetical protein